MASSGIIATAARTKGISSFMSSRFGFGFCFGLRWGQSQCALPRRWRAALRSRTSAALRAATSRTESGGVAVWS
jgi:hypothetical protein